MIFQAWQQWKEAIDCYENALKAESRDHAAWYNLASCQTIQGQTEGAIESLTRAVTLYPDKYRNLAQNEPLFEALRQDSRIQEVLSA
jgi:tetratricopeptide (TPR) repeat protein